MNEPKAYGHNVIVKPVNDKKESKFVMVEDSDDRIGVITSIPTECYTEDIGSFRNDVPFGETLVVGAKVLFHPHGTQTVEKDGEKRIAVPIANICMILE